MSGATGHATRILGVLSVALAIAGLLHREAAAAPATITTGVYIPGAAQQTMILEAFEARTGQPTGIVHWYQPWGWDYANGSWFQPDVDPVALRAVAARGATPMITWEAWGIVNGSDPSRVRTIPTGVYDDYIDSWARGLRDFGQPVFLRLFHELNNQRYPWAYGNNGNTAADLIAAWRYVYGRFDAIGATNVVWVWSPSTESGLVTFAELYPGDDYVDWLGVDGYNGGDVYPDWWDGWASPETVFEDSLNSLAAINATKPIMIAEAASVEQGGSKADWIAELYLQIPKEFPHVRAILWFIAAWGEDERANWLIDSSDASLEAYREAMEQIAETAAMRIRDRVAFGSLSSPGHRAWLRDLLSPF